MCTAGAGQLLMPATYVKDKNINQYVEGGDHAQ